jgi:hypothetical protein
MALQLEQLVFSVETGALDDARIKIAKLGDAVNSLNKPMQNMAVASAKTAEAIARAELAAEKARVATAKLGQENTEAAPKVNSLEKLLTKLTNTYLDMGRGFSKGEASILNQARSLGALDDQLALVEAALKNIKELNKDPFDSSLGGVRSITQEFERLTQRANLAAQGIMLTTKQLGEYSRLAAEARSKTIGEGLSLSSPEGQARMNQLLQEAQTDYLKTAASVNQLTEQERQRLAVLKEQEKAQRLANSASIERAKLQNDLILREQKLAFVNKELAAGLTTASANALFKYQKDLEAVGETADNVAKRTTAFRAALVEKQGFSPIKRIADDAAEARKQVDHLARALGPQITDIFVGLATGQSPMMVLLQQGGQLRDQFALAGVEGTKMGNALVTSAKYMITSIKDVSLAVGTLLGTAIINLGATAGTVLTKMTGDFFIIEGASAALSKSFPGLAEHIKNLGTAMHFFTGSIAIATFIGLAIAFKQIVQEESALSRALLTTGAAMGFTKQSAIEFAQSLEGVSESKAKDFLTELAKNSVENTGNLKELTKTAVDLEKYAGISLDETAKRYAELQKNPVEALTKLAIETGRVNVKTLEQAESMKEAKNYTDLAALANQEFARAMGEVAAAAYQNMSPIEKIFASIKSEATAGWTAFKEWANTPEVLKVVEIAWRGVSGVFTILLAGVKQIITGIGAISTALEKLGSLDLSGAWDSLKDGWDKIQAIGKDAMKDAFKPLTTGTNFAPGTSAAGDTTANARAAKAFEQQKKDRESARKELESDAKKQENYYKKVLDAANNYYEKMIGGAEELTQAEIRLQQLENDSEWKNLSKERQQKLKDIWLQNAALERQYKLTQEQRKVDIAAGEARNKLISDGIKEVETIQQRVKDQEIALGLLEYENSLIGTTQSQREYLVALKKEELEYEKKLAEIKAKGYLSGQESDAIAALDREFELRKKILSASTYQKEFKEMQDVLSGAIADALFEGGKKGADSLKNYLKTTFRKYVIDVLINPIVGSIMGSFGVQGGTSGAAGSFLGNMGSSVLTNAIGGISGVASAFGTAFSNAALSTVQGWVGMSGTAAQMGTSLANAGYYAGSAAGTTASGIGASIGAYAPYALAAVVALDQLGILDRWSGDPDAFLVQQAQGTRQSYSTSTTSALGTIGFVNGRGTIMKNGRLVSEKGETEGVPVTAQNTALELIRNLDNAIASTLNESQISSISKNLSGWYKKSWSFEGKMLEDWIASRYETILRGLDGSFGKVKDYQKEGEKLSETTVRLITNLTTVYGAFETLGISTRNVSAKFSTNLVEMLGGVSNFSSAMQYFYENFYSEEERFKNQSKRLTDSFAALGLAVPKTRDEFKKLLEGALSSGNTGLSGKLIALMQPLNDFISATEEVAVSVSSIAEEYARLTQKIMTNEQIAQQRIDLEERLFEATANQAQIAAKARSEIAGYNLALYDQVISAESAKKAEEARIEELRKAEEARLEIQKQILDQRKSLEDEYFQLTASQAEIAARARSEIDASNLAIYDMIVAVKAAKAAEELRIEEFKKTEEARLEFEKQINDERLSLQQRLFEATATEAQILAKARSEISAYNIALYDQVIAAENAKKAEEARAEAERVIQDQRKSLQDRLFEATATEAQIVEKVRSEIDASNLALYDQVIAAEKAKSASQKLADSMNQLTDSLLSEVDRLRGEIRNTSSISGNVTGLSAEYLSTVLSAKSGNMQAIEKLPEYTKAIEQAVTATAVNSYDVVYARAWLASSLSGVADTINGSTASTQTVGTPIISTGAAVQTNGASLISSNASSQAELIAALITEVQGLRAEVRADVSANTKTSRILERVNQDGDTLNVTAV